MHSLAIDSPAKLNLTLRVRGKRPDGFHELVTLFHRISLKDSLFLRKTRRGFRLICSHPGIPQKNNLITRAYEILKKQFPSLGGIQVRLIKRIPIGGGLGGGSSNAAAFLLSANRLFQLKLSRKKLLKLGAKLGSDIPFFVSGFRHALGEGRGERIRPFSFKRKLWFLLFPSKRGLSTRQVYSEFHLASRRASLTLQPGGVAKSGLLDTPPARC
jgi:4-diphosphocytidyl-2-C-methyl-D-erythritol kinase